MPTPKKNESKKDFVKRCIPIVLEDGTAESPEQAVAICNSMFEQARRKPKSFTRPEKESK